MAMTPFHRASVPEATVAFTIDDIVAKWEHGDAAIAKLLGHPQTITDARRAAKAAVGRIVEGEWWRNESHQVVSRVIQTPLGPMVHLSIKRLDRSPIHDWRELQDVKTTLLGPDVEGVELYPAEDRVVDTANQYHLWCAPPGERFPFGFHEGRHVTEASVAGSVQRPFAQPAGPAGTAGAAPCYPVTVVGFDSPKRLVTVRIEEPNRMPSVGIGDPAELRTKGGGA